MKKSIKNIFVEGAITPEKIAKSIAAHQSKTGIGASFQRGSYARLEGRFDI